MTQQKDREAVARERIEWVSSILGPGCDQDEVESTVRAMMADQWRYELGRPMNKTQKKAIAQAAKALRRWNTTLTNPKLPPSVRERLPVTLAELRKLQKELEQLGDASLDKPKRPTIYLRRHAAKLAGYLLQAHRLPLRATRGGKFHQLAAAIYGDKSADLFNHLRFYRGVRLHQEFYDE
ncbi:MAG: hypothetical protein WAK55_21705 [Xanthobacteraceae bacterium]